jgi:hypothetical protein
MEYPQGTNKRRHQETLLATTLFGFECLRGRLLPAGCVYFLVRGCRVNITEIISLAALERIALRSSIIRCFSKRRSRCHGEHCRHNERHRNQQNYALNHAISLFFS